MNVRQTSPAHSSLILPRIVIGTFVSLIALSAVLYGFWPRFSAEATYADGRHEVLKLMPWQFHGATTNAQLKVGVYIRTLMPTRWRVVPDDDLTGIVINNKAVSLQNISPDALRDWSKGFEFNFGPWLHDGENTLVFTLNNHGGDGGILLRPELGFRWILIWLSLLPWLYAMKHLFKLQSYQWAPIGLAMIVICNYWSITPWTVRAHDVWDGDGHIDYVMHVAETRSLPSPTGKWEFFQAPIYYIGGAAVWRWAQWLNLPAPESLQAYSLLLWLVFLAASSATLRMAVHYRAGLAFIGTTALAFWPSGIIESIAINNDVGLFACAGVATWYMLRWWRDDAQYELLLAALFVALGLLTKTSALVLAGTLAILMLLKLLRKHRWQHGDLWRGHLIAATIVTGGFALSVGRKLYYYSHGLIADWITGNSAINLGDWLKVPAKFGNFIPLDAATFLTHPWVELTKDESGRANFWNLLLRSSLTGEFSFAGRWQERIAYLWGIVLLILFFSVPLRFRSVLRRDVAWRNAPLLLLGAAWIASLISFRARIPYSCNNDFRYVLPVLVPFIAGSVSINAFNRFLLLLLALVSALFFLTAPYS